MEYVISFLTFFLVYFGITYAFKSIRFKTKTEENQSRIKTKSRKGGIKNNNSESTKQKSNSEFYKTLKNALLASLIYIVFILILKIFT